MNEVIAPPDRSPDSAVLLRTLAVLRWIAVAGQSITIVIAETVLGLPLAYGPLLIGVGVLAAFAAYASRSAWSGSEVGLVVVLLHVVFDIAQLTWQLYWSGGSANPFVSLYLLPIALVGFALPARQVLAVAGLAAAGYTFLLVAHRPLPNWHHHQESLFDLHLIGMWVNFLISAAVITAAAIRLSAVLGRQRRALAEAREAALRSEGVIAVATQAAAAAHALNTPLASMAVVAADLGREISRNSPLAEDLRVLQEQIEVCRDAVRRLVAEAALESRGPESLGTIARRVAERLALIVPEGQVSLRLPPEVVTLPMHDPTSVEHLLMNLLGNAVDASGLSGGYRAEIRASLDGSQLRLAIHDRGSGAPSAPTPFRSSKPDGLGLGVLLSRMLVERRGGTLALGRDAEGGRVDVALPIAPGTAIDR
jgi:two-component system sensor histidine kinase RegB